MNGKCEMEDGKGVTVQTEGKNLIPLKEWAGRNHLTDSYVRNKARRGMFGTARKIGRDWFIAEDEPNVDNRRKK